MARVTMNATKRINSGKTVIDFDENAFRPSVVTI